MMKVFELPGEEQKRRLLQRPIQPQQQLREIVTGILEKVKDEGDQALIDFTRMFDSVELIDIRVNEADLAKARVDQELQNGIILAKNNIQKFHQSQLIDEPVVETISGVNCWRKSVAIEKVGLYIPGGTAPLFSTVLMLGVPAALAGCREIVLCSPPDKNGRIHPALLFAANLLGIEKVYKVGGAQAIGAMAYGTESIPRVHKIFGPGNQFVTRAKEMVQTEGVAIDIPAGPSEVLVIADETSIPAFVAADLLSQAEHGVDSHVVLLSDKRVIINKILLEVEAQLDQLPRREIAEKALENSYAAVLESLDECIGLSNLYAPEHLILATRNCKQLADKVVNAGSVFLGNFSCESAGDYASGTNHTLPTNGFATSHSGVSIDSFIKKITFQEITETGIQNIGPAIEKMAETEGLVAHKRAVTLRLNRLKNV